MILNNHSKFALGESFLNKHQKLIDVFKRNNLTLEISEDLNSLKTLLTSLSKEEYPYDFDEFFLTGHAKNSPIYFYLNLKNHNEIVATYTARNMGVHKFTDLIKRKFTTSDFHKDLSEYLPKDKSFFVFNPFYSSCQWVKQSYRQKNIGNALDHLKKNIVFDIFDSDLNYCIHKQSLTDYHLQKLKYSSSKWIMTVPKGNVGGAGSEEDKIYHLAWEFKNDWNNKYNELQNEYQKY